MWHWGSLALPMVLAEGPACSVCMISQDCLLGTSHLSTHWSYTNVMETSLQWRLDGFAPCPGTEIVDRVADSSPLSFCQSGVQSILEKDISDLMTHLPLLFLLSVSLHPNFPAQDKCVCANAEISFTLEEAQAVFLCHVVDDILLQAFLNSYLCPVLPASLLTEEQIEVFAQVSHSAHIFLFLCCASATRKACRAYVMQTDRIAFHI